MKFNQQAWRINCKATSKDMEKSPYGCGDQPLWIEILQKFYWCGQIWYAINSLKETLSISNRHAPFGLRLDQAKTK